MSAITPVTALPANGVSPSGMLTSALPQIRLQAVTASGGSRLTLIQKSEGGDWFKVPAERVLSGRKLNESKAVLDLATGEAGEVIISNDFGSTAYHVLEENGGFAGNENGTVTAYIAGASAPVTTGDLSASNVTASGTLSVGTTATLTGAVTMAAAATVGTTLGVTGASTLTGNVTFGGKQIATATANVIADPGTGAAIPVTTSGVCMITTAAAETNTLAIPSFVGQRLALICDVYAVGNRVVTSAQAINQTGNTIMTFGAAGDMIELTAMKVGGALRWRVTANDGCALS